MNDKPGIIIKLRMIFTLIWILILFVFVSVLTIILSVLSFGKLQNFLVTWVGYILGRGGLTAAGVKVKIKYHEDIPKDPAIFLINHSSTLDLFIVMSIFLPRVRYIAKKELQYNPFFWILSTFLGQIMIDRKDPRSVAAQLEKAYRHVKKNRLSLMFAPEGTRSRTGAIGPFKSGAFHAATSLGYPVVPIYIEGAHQLCPGNSLITRPGTVTVHFHPQIDTSDWDSNDIRKYSNEIRDLYLGWAGQKNPHETQKADNK